jgi:hypothetical protein
VENRENHTRNEWRRCKTTLDTSGEDAKLHSKRVKKMKNYTRDEWRRCKTTLETSGEDEKLHSRRVEKMIEPSDNRIVQAPDSNAPLLKVGA